MKNRRAKVRLVDASSESQLAREWDKIAAERDELIVEGRDLSYSHILLPALRRLSLSYLSPGGRVLDVGCGTGVLAAELADEFPKCTITGIDPSKTSIRIASERRTARDNLVFRNESIERFVVDDGNHATFDLIIANMLLQNVVSMAAVLDACARALNIDGVFVFAVPHPCFWPRYWKYDEESWFRYDRELWIEAPFRTSLYPNGELSTTHTHRPLSRYIKGFQDAGLVLEELVEPYPDEGIEGEYPIAWEFPRFLLGRCRPLGGPTAVNRNALGSQELG